MVGRFALAVFVSTSLLSSDVGAQVRGRGYAGITVFENSDFRGRNFSFREAIPDLREAGLNDRITSLQIEGSQAWEVCRDINFSGGCRVFTGSVEDLRREGWNDRISSLRPAGFGRGFGNVWGNNRNSPARGRNTDTRLVLFERANYRGDSRDIERSSANLGEVGDRARSVRVYGGEWELCDGPGRNGLCVTVTEDVPDLHRLGLRRGVTSAREVRSGRRF